MLLRQRHELVDVRGVAVDHDRDDRLGPRRNGRGDRHRVHRPRVRVNVHHYRHRVAVEDGRARRERREGGHDDLVPDADAAAEQRAVEGGRAVRVEDPVLVLEALRERFLQHGRVAEGARVVDAVVEHRARVLVGAGALAHARHADRHLVHLAVGAHRHPERLRAGLRDGRHRARLRRLLLASDPQGHGRRRCATDEARDEAAGKGRGVGGGHAVLLSRLDWGCTGVKVRAQQGAAPPVSHCERACSWRSCQCARWPGSS
eukprot:COSAG06_NODE_927_length_11495_cov_5.212969_3_plen_260_part_00